MIIKHFFMRACACLLLVSGTAAADSTGEEARTQAVNALFAEFDRADRPGLAVAIYHQGRQVYSAGFGTANLELGVPITPRTVFMAGSIGKQFTGYCVAELARQGKIDLTADVRTYLPWVPDFGKPITVLNLLHHTSGLRDVFHLSGLGGHSLQGLVQRQSMLRVIARQEALNFEPGTQYLYSNTNYILLAEIIQKVSGQTVRELSEQRIFAPLGMKQTLWYDDIGAVLPGRSESYDAGKAGGWRRSLFSRDTVGATSFYTTAEDLIKWARNFLHPQAVGDAALFQQLTTMGRLSDGGAVNYGLGIARERYAGHEAWAHGGGGAAYVGTVAYFPNDDFAVAILANSPVSLSPKVTALVKLYLGDAAPAAESQPVSPAKAVSESLPGQYASAYSKLITIVRQGNGWTWQSVDGTQNISFRGKDAFDLGPGGESSYRLRRDSRGRVQGFDELTEDGSVWGFERVSAAPPSAAALTEFAGDYHSDELDVTYTFAVENGRLIAQTPWLAQTKTFTPSVPDRFDSTAPVLEMIVFSRNSDGQLTGFKSYSDRTRHVYFNKVAR